MQFPNWKSLHSGTRNVMHNASILLSGSVMANIFGLLSLAIFTHSQGPVKFGFYVLFLTFIEIVDRIFNFQTWQAFIKFGIDFQVKNEHHNVMMLLKYSFFVDLISLIVSFSAASALSTWFVSYFHIPQSYLALVILMSTTILFKGAELSTGVFRLFDEFKIQAKIVTYSSIIKFILFGIISLTIPSFEYFVYATVLSQFITMMMKFVSAKKILNRNDYRLKNIINEKINIGLMKDLEILSFIVYNNFDVAVRMLSRQLDVVILGKLYGAEAVGLYKIAKEVANLIGKITDPLYQAIYPEFAKLLANSKKEEAKRLAKNISLSVGVVGLVFFVLFALVGREAIGLVFGAEFVDAYWVTLVYALAIFIGAVTLPLYPMQHAFGFAKNAFLNQLKTTLIYIPVMMLLLWRYGSIGASVAYILYYLYLTALTLKSVKKGFK